MLDSYELLSFSMLPSRSNLLKLALEFKLLTLLLNGDWNWDFGAAPLLVLPLSRYAVVLLRFTPFVWPLVCLADLVDHEGEDEAEDLGFGARFGYIGLEFEVWLREDRVRELL